jgi:hypothetical protein
MSHQFIRDEVCAFRLRFGFVGAEEDSFPAWYLHHRHGVAASDAISHTADSGESGGRKNYDFGLDAFHFLPAIAEPPTLILIQAKYTDSITAISSGFKDLARCLPRVGEALSCAPSAAFRENRVLASLREQLRQLDEATRQAMKLRFEVIHLSDADEMVIRANTRKAWDELSQAVRDDPLLESRLFEVDEIGPRRMGVHPVPPAAPTVWHDLELDAVPLTVSLDGRAVTMYSGIGRLADIVDLYNARRGDLFARNVRYFLTTAQNLERGPSGKIRETLRQMCIPRKDTSPQAPELFAFHHNGITIFARDVQSNAQGQIQRLREPYVLNGCQTVRTAYDFRFDAKTTSKIDESLWRRVAVPIRIITTQQDELVRQITISNNRQNPIPPSALRANDPIQLELEQRFERRGIFYERQKGAYDELVRSNTTRLDQFTHTNGRAVRIDDLARCLAAVAGEFDLAHSPSHIFEYDAAYQKVFSAERIASIPLLVFLQNLHDVLPTILKKDIGFMGETPKSPRSTRLVYYTMCLLMRYFADGQRNDIVRTYGENLLGKEKGLRADMAQHLDNYHSRIKRTLSDYFAVLEETTVVSLREAFRKAASHSGFKDNIDVFGALAHEES